ncbi:methyl-accepting chemotaxis protein, partial [Vibrio campbellii]
MNSVLINQLAERFNLAVTIGDEEMLEANRNTVEQIVRNFQLQQKLQPTLSSQVNQLERDVNVYFESAYKVAFGMIDGDINLQQAAKLAADNSVM